MFESACSGNTRYKQFDTKIKYESAKRTTFFFFFHRKKPIDYGSILRVR